jgi:hypothetical protein
MVNTERNLLSLVAFWRAALRILAQVTRRQSEQRVPSRQPILQMAVLVALLVFPGLTASGQKTGTSDYEVKAAFLFNFAKFVDWPSNSFPTPDAPFLICVLGQDPFGNILEGTLRGRVIGKRPLAIRRLKDKSNARGCQIVFVSSSENAHLVEVVASMRRASLLLVGDVSGFAALGGAIEFTMEDNRVRFTINADAADRSGLTFSSKLLALAKIVHDEKHSKGE